MTNSQSTTDISNLPPGTEVEVLLYSGDWADGYIVESFSSTSYVIGSATGRFGNSLMKIADLGRYWRFKSFPPQQTTSKDKIWEAVVAASR